MPSLVSRLDPPTAMHELQEFEKNAKEKRREKDSIKKALEDGRLKPVSLRLPKVVERRRREPEGCSPMIKLILVLIVVTLVGMLCYAVWRIRAIEEPSESSDYDYNMINAEEVDDTTENDVIDTT